jgi:ABC-type uncharacterized transport system permease subunit
MITTISILAIIAYVATWGLIVYRVRIQLNQQAQISRTYLKITWLVALLAQASTLYFPLIQHSTLSLDLISAFSHVLWLISLLIFYTTFRCKIETLGLFIIPLLIISIMVRPFITGWQVTELSGGLGLHIFTSLLAYSVLLFAAVQALVLAYQNHCLHQHRMQGLVRTLPALQDMEALLFRLIAVGVVLLTISLGSGFIYLEGFFQHAVAHKAIFSFIAWILLVGLLFKRYRYGCRGRLAIRWTLFASAFLFLAYFGSKFVFEYVLH